MAVSCSRRCSQAQGEPSAHSCPVSVKPHDRGEVPVSGARRCTAAPRRDRGEPPRPRDVPLASRSHDSQLSPSECLSKDVRYRDHPRHTEWQRALSDKMPRRWPRRTAAACHRSPPLHAIPSPTAATDMDPSCPIPAHVQRAGGRRGPGAAAGAAHG